MAKNRTYLIYMDRYEYWSELHTMYYAGLVQGLIYGLCAVPCGTTLWDCERFDKFVLYRVDCTSDCIHKFMEHINMCPIRCRYEEVKTT